MKPLKIDKYQSNTPKNNRMVYFLRQKDEK